MVVLGEGEGGVPGCVILLGVSVWLREGRGEEVPVCCYDGIAFDVDAFGFCFLADAGTGGSVFLFLEWTRHFLE